MGGCAGGKDLPDRKSVANRFHRDSKTRGGVGVERFLRLRGCEKKSEPICHPRTHRRLELPQPACRSGGVVPMSRTDVAQTLLSDVAQTLLSVRGLARTQETASAHGTRLRPEHRQECLCHIGPWLAAAARKAQSGREKCRLVSRRKPAPSAAEGEAERPSERNRISHKAHRDGTYREPSPRDRAGRGWAPSPPRKKPRGERDSRRKSVARKRSKTVRNAGQRSRPERSLP
jgi:hypothetical protein